jgi:hypothetical protein
MKSHKISVTVDADSIRVTPDPLIMTSDDDVRWEGMNPRRFSIEFDGSGPFATSQLDPNGATSPQRPRGKGRFKYTVVSEDTPSLRLDPVIVVEDPPTGTVN